MEFFLKMIRYFSSNENISVSRELGRCLVVSWNTVRKPKMQ